LQDAPIDENQESDSDQYTSDEEEENVELDGLGDEYLKDMERATNTPVEEPPSRCGTARILVTWVLYFLVVWQAAVHLSDNGLEWLLRFFSKFFFVVGLQSDFVAGIAAIFPGSLYLMRKYIGIDRDSFTRYVVCPKCTKLYRPEECTKIVNGQQVALRCTNMLPFRKQKVECGHQLVKEVKLTSGKTMFYPLKVYCYRSVIETLEKFVKRNGFTEKCESWRNREVNENEYGDVYDGQIWKDFMYYKGEPFLFKERNYALMMNCDWFQPYKRRNDYSVGVIYLIVMNLPRAERFLKENIIVVGIIPSLKKEPSSLNEFLHPLVEELSALWRGIRFITSASPMFPFRFRAALLCASSDIPAARKLCGFLGHSANLGCSRCFKKFPGGFAERKDYSGFERDKWEIRTDKEQRKRVKIVLRTHSKSQRKNEERRLGVRYTALLKLTYYDSIRFCVIDPMHNLFLGTSKSMFKLWIERGILTNNDLKTIDKKIAEIKHFTDIGRIPTNISSNYGSFTAEEWKNWTMLISMYALKDVLPERDFKCWQTYVLACRTICKPFITLIDINTGDFLLIKFCKEVEKIYGATAIKPNMHLHGHLKECMMDYGPLYGFWCFSFERYNGLLGGFKTNNRSPEIQIMRKFNVLTFCYDFTPPEQYKDEFMVFVGNDSDETSSMYTDSNVSRQLLKAVNCPLGDFDWGDVSFITLPGAFTRGTLDKADTECLRKVYQLLYPNISFSSVPIHRVIKKYGIISVGAETYGSKMSCRSLKSARIRAAYAGADGKICRSLVIRPGCVNVYFKHEIKVNDTWKHHVFAVVNWYCEHPNKHLYGNPIEVWRNNAYEPGGPSSFLPVQRICGKFAACVQNISSIESLIVSPVPYKIYL